MTISIAQLQEVRHLVTHTSTCHDAIASALIIQDVLPHVKVSFVQYETPAHKKLEAAPGMLFCDMSPPRARLQEFIDVGAIVLDHHDKQEDIVQAFGDLGVFGDSARGESGAVLARDRVWEVLRPGVRDVYWDRVDAMARLVAIRDTWQTSDPKWEEACRFTAELCFWGFEGVALRGPAFPVSPVVSLGRRLIEQQNKDIRYRLNESYRFLSRRGTDVVMFEGLSLHASEAAELLDRMQHSSSTPVEQPNIVATFHYFREDDDKIRIKFSCRSHTGYDVGAFAHFSSDNGGGHKAAAGFTLTQSAEVGSNPYSVFRTLLDKWEDR